MKVTPEEALLRLADFNEHVAQIDACRQECFAARLFALLQEKEPSP